MENVLKLSAGSTSIQKGRLPNSTELGVSMTDVGKKLGISVSTVSGAVKKGRQTVEKEGLKLLDLLNVEM